MQERQRDREQERVRERERGREREKERERTRERERERDGERERERDGERERTRVEKRSKESATEIEGKCLRTRAEIEIGRHTRRREPDNKNREADRACKDI